jgi:hypothetical protein
MSRLRILGLAALVVFIASNVARGDAVLVETEGFRDPGGWVLDTQFIDIMGSPYLMAHGLGQPVKDAETTVTFPGTGKYHLWVRTLDWVARWKAPGAPGRFQLAVGGKIVPVTFGTVGEDWHWQDGGSGRCPVEGDVNNAARPHRV